MSISSPLSSAGAPVDRAALRGPDGRPIRVLVVDDEPTLSELVGLALRYEGWEVRTAADGHVRHRGRPRVPARPGRARRDAARHRRAGGAAPARGPTSSGCRCCS